MNSGDLKMYKYVKISKSNFFTITLLSLHSICSESKKYQSLIFTTDNHHKEPKEEKKSDNKSRTWHFFHNSDTRNIGSFLYDNWRVSFETEALSRMFLNITEVKLVQNFYFKFISLFILRNLKMHRLSKKQWHVHQTK